jgi:type IV pilus assembly protein PilV
MNTRGFSVRSSTSRERGFSLVEVLISIIILSFGMLGMVGMQAASLQANREARLQSTAAVLARELAEMMRGNQKISAGTTSATNPYLGDFTAGSFAVSTPSYCLSVGSTCADNTAVANAQMTEWLSRVQTELPGARVKVCMDTAPYDTDGLPQWNCTAGAASNDIAVIKMGWSRGSTNRAATAASAIERTSDSGNKPIIIFAITPGKVETP